MGVSASSNTVSGNIVSITLNTQSSSQNNQMQTTEFPQYSPLSPAAWTIKCRQQSFHSTHRSVQQPGPSNAGNRVSTVLTAQSSSLDHQMQATEFPQYSPLSPAAWTIKCRQQSFHSTHRSVQQPGPSNAGIPPRCSPCGWSPAQPDCQAVAAGLT